MNQVHAMAEPSAQTPEVAVNSPVRDFYWSVRRELWEHRSVYLASPAVGAVFLIGFLLNPHLAANTRAALAADPMKQHSAITAPYQMAAGIIMLTAMIVGFIYSLDALYGERRERTILFWKSLPVGNFTTVLAKASIPIFVLPLVASAVIMAMQWIMLVAHSAVLHVGGMSVAPFWEHVSPFRMSLMVIYHLVTVHGLLHAPFYAWLLLVSAWARRMPFLWAVLPPVAIIFAEKMAFNTSYFAGTLGRHLAGGMEAVTSYGQMPTDPMMTRLTLGNFLVSPVLWTGLIFTAICLVAAARLRRQRDPI